MTIVKSVVDRLVEKWNREIAAAAGAEKESNSANVVVNDDMSSMTLDIISLVAFNIDSDTLNHENGSQFASDLNDMGKYILMRAFSPVPYWRIPLIGQYLDGAGWARRRLHIEVRKLVREYDDNPGEDFGI